MSDGSRLSATNSTGECPVFTAIGARDLMRAKPNAKTGFLRRRGKRERLAETFKINAILPWRQVFVVLTDGCLYNYWTEHSTGHFKALVLKGFNRISRVNEWGAECFKIEAADPTKKNHIYSCINDHERKEWMNCIRKEMASANNVSGDTGISRGSASPDYEDLEQPLYQYASSGDGSAGMLKGYSDEEEGSDDSDYDQITEWEIPGGKGMKRELPPVPDEDVPPVNKGGTLQYAVPNNNNNTTSSNRSSTLPAASRPRSPPEPNANTNTRAPPPTPAKPSKGDKAADDNKHDYINAPEKKPKPVPKPVPKPKNVKRTPSENEYLFDDNNREKALALLKGKPQGTYLIRKARQGDYKVLAVLVDDGKGETKEYKIFTEAEGVTLNHKDYYTSTEALLMAYVETPLPNHSARLTRPYSTSQ